MKFKYIFLLVGLTTTACGSQQSEAEAKKEQAVKEVNESLSELREQSPQREQIETHRLEWNEFMSWTSGLTVGVGNGTKTVVDKMYEKVQVYAVGVTIENTGTQTFDYSATDFELRDADGFTYEIQPSTQMDLDRGLGIHKKITPGETVKGFLAFPAPESIEGIKVIYNFYGQPAAIWER